MCDKEYSGMFSLSAALDESTRGYKKLDQMHKNKKLPLQKVAMESRENKIRQNKKWRH